ncbi:MAG: tetratricopeptide repeat protein [Bacteroidetes bacterium]|nr:tetratricopeptide repeat protein [Bacteroidota bacterium]
MRLLIILTLFAITIFAQPGDIGNKIMLAQQFEQLNQFEKAKTIYLDLYKVNPGDYMLLESVVRVCNRLKQFDESLTWLNKWNERSPGDINGVNLTGKTLFLSGKEKDALDLWHGFLKNAGYDINYTKILAYSAIEVKGFETAISLLEKGKEVSGKPIYFLLDLGYLYGYVMQFDKAAEAYVELLQLEPGQAGQIEGRIKATSNNPDAVKEYIKAFEKVDDPGEAALRVLFSLYIDQRMFEKGLQTALKLESFGRENGVSLFKLGEESFYAGDYPSAVTAYSTLLEKYPGRPDKPVINLNLVKALEELLNLKYLELNPEWKPYDREILPPKSEYEKVIGKYSEIISTFKNSETASEAIFRTGYLWFKLKDYDEAESFFDKLIEERPNSQFTANCRLYKGLIAIRKGEPAQAEHAFKAAITSFTTDPDVKNRAKFNLMMCSLFKNDIPATTSLLAEILSVPSDNLANDALELSPLLNKNMADSLSLIAFAKGEEEIMKGNLEEAYKIFSGLAAANSKIVASVAVFRTAELAASLDRYDDAISVINQSVKDPMNIYADKSLFLQGEIYNFGKKDIPKAIAAYEQILINFPKSILYDKARETILSIKTN